MRRFALLVSLPALLMAVPSRADDLKTADEVIAKNIEAMGGKEKLDSVKSVRMTGKINQQGMEFPGTIEIVRPDKVRLEFTVQGMIAIQAFDGKEGWFTMPFMGKTEPEKMPPEMVEHTKETAEIEGPLVDYKKKGHEVELMGTEDLEGTAAYKLKVTKKNGDTEYHFIEKESFLPIGAKGKRKMMGTEVEFETGMSDFKEVDGLMLPHSMENKMPMGTISMKFETIEINVPIDDARFAMPPEKKEAEGEKKEEGEKKAEEKKDGGK